MFDKKTIYGCEARGDANDAYLTRFTLLETKQGRLYLHIFHRSDADDLHDHPWSFWTLILWRGYIEHYRAGHRSKWVETWGGWARQKEPIIRKRRLLPGRILRRKANFAHRVELIDGQKAITLVWVGRPERDWGFFTPKGWVQWRKYFQDKGC